MSVVTTLNAIRATATSAYQDTVPLATMSNITEVGKSVLDAPQTILNEFLSALINKVGLQLFNDRQFTNPLIDLRKGTVKYGQTIEDIFIEMAKAKAYTTGTREDAANPGQLEAAPDQFEVQKAIAKTGFYYKIFGRQYHTTIHRNDLERAFFSGDGVNRLVSSIMTSMRNGEQYDDYRIAIALVARQIEQSAKDQDTKWNGRIKLVTDYNALYNKTLTAADALKDKDFLQYLSNQFKKWSNRLAKPRRDLNPSGVTTWLPKPEQRIMMLSDVQADLDTNLFAWAYNEERLQIGAIDEIDAWYSIGREAGAGGTVKPDDITVKGTMGLTGGDPEAAIPCLGVIYHANMIKLYDKTRVSTTAENARGLYYNIFNTYEDYIAASPFENFVAFFLE